MHTREGESAALRLLFLGANVYGYGYGSYLIVGAGERILRFAQGRVTKNVRKLL
jgi:hypothetical protein